MNTTITTDIFCDICHDWICGVTGIEPHIKQARKVAKQNGWTRRRVNGRMLDLCTKCSKGHTNG